jgi:hypothetical protein
MEEVSGTHGKVTRFWSENLKGKDNLGDPDAEESDTEVNVKKTVCQDIGCIFSGSG